MHIYIYISFFDNGALPKVVHPSRAVVAHIDALRFINILCYLPRQPVRFDKNGMCIGPLPNVGTSNDEDIVILFFGERIDLYY